MKTVHQVIREVQAEEFGASGPIFLEQAKEIQLMLDLSNARPGGLIPMALRLAKVSDIRSLWMTYLQLEVKAEQVPRVLHFHPKAVVRAALDSRDEGNFGMSPQTERSLLDALSMLLLDCPWPDESDDLTPVKRDFFLDALRLQWLRLQF